MGAAPQTPRFFLPQAEYLSTAPNSTIALQGRRRYTLNVAQPGSSVPGGQLAQFTAELLLEAPFPHGAAIFVHDVWIQFISGDSSGELQITGLALGLTRSTAVPNIPAYSFGAPLLTTLTPVGATVGLRDQEKLVTSDDMTFLTNQFLNNTSGPNLLLVGQVFIKNLDPTNAHTMQATAQIIYTRLDGVTE